MEGKELHWCLCACYSFRNRDESKHTSSRHVHFNKRLDDIAGILEQQNGHHGMPGSTTPEEVLELLNDPLESKSQRIYAELVEHLWNPRISPDESARIHLGTNAEMLRHCHGDFERCIVRSLEFETMQLRQESIPRAYQQTFGWIFQPSIPATTDAVGWPSFTEWLESNDTRPFWITGKPGSGKSTLMNYITRHPNLLDHLTAWAQDKPVFVLSYYAWIAGMTMQKSCEGLMRTMTHHLLEQIPALVPTVAPRRWALLNTLRSADAVMPPWVQWEVEESFEKVLSYCGKDFNLAVFVDGLDEFEMAPLAVVELIQRLNTWDGVKICVASRQWIEFNDAFGNNPMVRMQDLTGHDIEHFVRSWLGGSQGFLDLQRVFPAQAAEVIDEVVRKSSGVFLWVSIVVKSLLVALTEGDGLDELQATINRLPSEVSHLYDAILDSISDRNIHKSAEILTLFKTAKGQLHYMTLWLADERLDLSFDLRSLPPDAGAGIADLMKRRLDSRTRGILEISNAKGIVQFLHVRFISPFISTSAGTEHQLTLIRPCMLSVLLSIGRPRTSSGIASPAGSKNLLSHPYCYSRLMLSG